MFFVCVIVYMRYATDYYPIVSSGSWKGIVGNSPKEIMVLVMTLFLSTQIAARPRLNLIVRLSLLIVTEGKPYET